LMFLVYAASHILPGVSSNTAVITTALVCQTLIACVGLAGVVIFTLRRFSTAVIKPATAPTSGAAGHIESDLDDLEAGLLLDRFRNALDGSGMVAFEQDENLTYRWLYNAPKSSDGTDMHAQTDFDLFPADVAEQLSEVKRRVMASREREAIEQAVPVEGGDTWYRIDIAPLTERPGLAAVATDITEFKTTQAKHQILMRELAHRIKNLLAVIDGIVRQTAKSHNDIETFERVFSERLRGLAATHDLLIQTDWAPLDLAELARSQTEPAAGDLAGRIVLDGPRISVDGDVAQHFGLALHELTTNALKYGSLSAPDGRVEINWVREVHDGTAQLNIVWREIGGPSVSKPECAGFGTFLTTRAVESGLSAKVEREFASTGFVWRASFPVD